MASRTAMKRIGGNMLQKGIRMGNPMMASALSVCLPKRQQQQMKETDYSLQHNVPSCDLLQIRAYAKGGKREKGGKSGRGGKSEANGEEGDAITELDYKGMKEKLNKYMDGFKKSIQQLNTGRANPALLENIKVKLNTGDVVPIKSIANIVVKSQRLLAVNVFDQGSISAVDRAIRETNLGFNPQSKGTMLEVPVPKMSKEMREGIVKQARHLAEATKENVRLVRRDAMNQIKEIKKHIPKDNAFQMEKELQSFIDTWVKKVDELLASKEKDLMQA